MLIGIALNVYIVLGRIDVFTVLTHEHSICLFICVGLWVFFLYQHFVIF